MVPSLPLWLKVPLMPKLLLALAACAWAKLGCCRLQLPASERPDTVNKSSTPPLGAFGLGFPLASKKKGKRASRVGPLAVMNDGIVLVEPLTNPLAIT